MSSSRSRASVLLYGGFLVSGLYYYRRIEKNFADVV